MVLFNGIRTQELVDQIYKYAIQLHTQEGKTTQEVRQILMEEGLDEESATIVVNNITRQLYLAKKGNGQKDMLYGALWCVGGIVVTIANIGFIFWGAIIFGGIQFIKGVANYLGD
ncbi:MAG: hypothetical protein ACFB0B_14075 [Thermonemataceae bacterium]